MNHGEAHRVPIVDEHMYLGIKLSYGRFEDLSIKHRLSLGNASQTTLRPWYANVRGVGLRMKFGVWTLCVAPCQLYGLGYAGLAEHRVRSFVAQCMHQLRHVGRNHAFATGLSHAAFLAHHTLTSPLKLLQQTMASRVRC